MTVSYSPKVSVIMNCLNGEKYLRDAIESVYAQTYQNWEIVLLDNASTDNTETIANSFDQKLRYFRNSETVPLGHARNLALQQAQGELIAFLDSDDIWFPSKLEQQIPLFENAPLVGLVFSDTILRYQEDGKSTSYFVEHDFSPSKGNIFSALLIHYSIPMLTVVIRKEVLSGLDEWFDAKFQVCDDYDFFLRITYNWSCDYVDVPLASCLIHNEAATVKFHGRAATEKLKALDKLLIYYPDIEDRYSKELEKLRIQISYNQGKSLWRDGESAAARTELSSYMANPKFLVTYFGTYFPYHWVKSLVRCSRYCTGMLRSSVSKTAS